MQMVEVAVVVDDVETGVVGGDKWIVLPAERDQGWLPPVIRWGAVAKGWLQKNNGQSVHRLLDFALLAAVESLTTLCHPFPAFERCGHHGKSLSPLEYTQTRESYCGC